MNLLPVVNRDEVFIKSHEVELNVMQESPLREDSP